MKANKILTAIVSTTLVTGVPALASTHAKGIQDNTNQEQRQERQERNERGERDERGEREENSREQARLARKAKISLEQARAIALQRAAGTVESEELEREKGKLVYSFDIRNAQGTIIEVQVSAIDGQVVSVEEETAQQEADEKRKEEQRTQRTRRPQ